MQLKQSSSPNKATTKGSRTMLVKLYEDDIYKAVEKLVPYKVKTTDTMQILGGFFNAEDAHLFESHYQGQRVFITDPSGSVIQFEEPEDDIHVCMKGSLDGMDDPVVGIFSNPFQAEEFVKRMNEYYHAERFYTFITKKKQRQKYLIPDIE